MITSLKQSKTKFELRITWNHNLSNKKYNSVYCKLNAKSVIMVKTYIYILMECLHCVLSCVKGA